MHVKKIHKNVFVEIVWPANLALFVPVSTHCVETIKWLDYNRHSQLTRWCSGNASALGARGPGFNPRLRQGFLCLIFCFVVVVFLLFCPKHIIYHKRLQLLTILFYLVYLTYCKICDTIVLTVKCKWRTHIVRFIQQVRTNTLACATATYI